MCILAVQRAQASNACLSKERKTQFLALCQFLVYVRDKVPPSTAVERVREAKS